MDNLRLILWVLTVGLIWATIQAWQLEHRPAAPVQQSATAPPSATAIPPPPVAPALPGSDAAAAGAVAASAAASPVVSEAAAPIIRVRTDVLDAEIDARDGDLRQVRLPGYPVHKDQPDVPVELLSPDPKKLFLFHTGLRAAQGSPEANHTSVMQARQTSYELAPGADELLVTLTWEAPGQAAVDKTYRFRRGRYDIDLEYKIRNRGAAPYTVASYLQIQRLHAPPERSYFDVDSYSFTGPVVYDGGKYEKLDIDELATQPLSQRLTKGWIASIQHHFLAAAVPPADQEFGYEGAVSQGVYTLSAVGPAITTAPGGESTVTAKLFVGPKLQAQLEETAKGLDLTVDYGVLALLAQPLFWLLQEIHKIVGNWGWAIIIATFIIKLAFYKLTEASGRSMARMRKLQPRLAALQERYKDDRQKLSEALMDLYKREKINPAAGCLPMLIQIPFFIAYYWVLLESVEMRQAPFTLWITDLSSRDPFFILPLLMAVAMYVQTSLNPAPPDPVQAKIMKFMPVAFAAMFAFFPAGLVLYWLTNSVLSILQQWRINKVLAAD
jgi:YidC/Oxa1 family membrane protein insertase